MSAASYYAKDCLGKNVENLNSDKLGTIDDMAIAQNGEILYLIVGFNGFLGMGEDKVAVPYDRFNWNEQKQCLVLDATEDQLKNAPKINKDNVPQATDAAYFGSVSTYYTGLRNAA